MRKVIIEVILDLDRIGSEITLGELVDIEIIVAAEKILDATVRDWFEKRGLALPSDYAGHLDLCTSYTCGGYGARDARVDALIEEALLRCALPLDPTYTGKALRGALDYLRDNDVSNASVLFLHTGGTPLFYDYLASTRGSVYSN